MIKPLVAFWPPWRFGTNIKSKNDADIETLSDGCVAAEWCFAGLVIAGIVGEFVIAAIHPPYDSLLGWWGPAYADLVVAVGIVFEVIAGVAAHTCQNELTRRSNDRLAQVEFDNGYLEESAAQAHERAAKLELELAKLKTPRRLGLDQVERVGAKLSDFAGTRISLGASPQTFESTSFATTSLKWALEKAGLLVRGSNAEALAHIGLARGVVIKYTLGNQRGEALASAVMHALVEEGIAAGTQAGLREEAIPAAEAAGGSRNDAEFEWVVIAVGEKM